MIQDRNLNKEERREFCSRYLKYRNAGETVKESFRLAEMELKAEGKRAPSFRCLRSWVANGVPDCPEIDMGKVRGLDVPAEDPEDESPAAETTEDEPAEDKPAEDIELMKLIIRAYRLRSESSIDALVDYLLFNLFLED